MVRICKEGKLVACLNGVHHYENKKAGIKDVNTVVKLKMDMFTEVCKESQVFIKFKRLSEK